MATVLPFKAIRSASDKVQLVASRTVDTYSAIDLKEKLAGNPYTFLHVINPDFSSGEKTKAGSAERLQKIKSRFLKFLEDDILFVERKEAYYLYRQVKQDAVFTGIIARTSIDDYFKGIIRVHEETLTKREGKLRDYLEVCDFNAEPVLFCYPDNKEINKVIGKWLKMRPEYDFTTTDQIRHTLWVITDPLYSRKLRKQFEKIPAIYIADGHHRSSSSALLGRSKREKNKKYSGNEPWNFYLGVFLAESQLRIYDYNRVVKDLNGSSAEALLEKVSHRFDVKVFSKGRFTPSDKFQFGMYLDKKWYSLSLKKSNRPTTPAASLDAVVLSEYLLSPVLNIRDLRTDKRIGFIPGVKGPSALEKAVDSGEYAIAFSLFPVTMKELKHIADTKSIMPPKTTWIEPKMRSGLVIYSIADN